MWVGAKWILKHKQTRIFSERAIHEERVREQRDTLLGKLAEKTKLSDEEVEAVWNAYPGGGS